MKTMKKIVTMLIMSHITSKSLSYLLSRNNYGHCLSPCISKSSRLLVTSSKSLKRRREQKSISPSILRNAADISVSSSTSSSSSKSSSTTSMTSHYSSSSTRNDSNNDNDPFRSFISSRADSLLKSSGSSSNNSASTTTLYSSSFPNLSLTKEEKELFSLLKDVAKEYAPNTTLRVAGGWVRDKLLATPEFNNRVSMRSRLTSKYASSGRKGTSIISSSSFPQAKNTTMLNTDPIFKQEQRQQQPLDIDIALDDMLGREFADLINSWLFTNGKNSISVGVVLKNPDKSKHLETATMKLGQFWIDFVNLRAEEYVSNSRIPDLMRIGSPEEDALRRDLTINALFYNINENTIEDFTSKGLNDLKRGVIATPLPPLTTLLDDPLRVLRAIRFAARLRFTMDHKLRLAAQNERVRTALSQKVSRERIGSELDLMLRSPDPVGAVRLLNNLDLISTVFPITYVYMSDSDKQKLYSQGLALLSTTHDYLLDSSLYSPAISSTSTSPTMAADGESLMENEYARRILWYASFLKPLFNYYQQRSHDQIRPHGKKAHRSIIMHIVIDHLKRSAREAEHIETIIRAANEFSECLTSDMHNSMTMAVLLHGVKVQYVSVADTTANTPTVICSMLAENGRINIHSDMVQDPIWRRCMNYRLKLSQIMDRVGNLWRAALILSLSEQLSSLNHGDEFDVAIEGDVIEQSHGEMRQGIMDNYDAFAVALMQLGLVGIWNEKPLLTGYDLKERYLKHSPKGPLFRDIMDEQVKWMRLHPGGSKNVLVKHLQLCFPEYF